MDATDKEEKERRLEGTGKETKSGGYMKFKATQSRLSRLAGA
jgi:hypothetical protein